MALTGEVTRKAIFYRSVGGELAVAGNAERATVQIFYKAVSGALDFAGDLTRKAYFKRSVSGALDFAGVIERLTGVILGSVLDFAGTLTRKVRFLRDVQGILDTSGGLNKAMRWRRLVEGVLSFSSIAYEGAISLLRRGLGRLGFNLKDD